MRALLFLLVLLSSFRPQAAWAEQTLGLGDGRDNCRELLDLGEGYDLTEELLVNPPSLSCFVSPRGSRDVQLSLSVSPMRPNELEGKCSNAAACSPPVPPAVGALSSTARKAVIAGVQMSCRKNVFDSASGHVADEFCRGYRWDRRISVRLSAPASKYDPEVVLSFVHCIHIETISSQVPSHL
jgi:hypothetical protein